MQIPTIPTRSDSQLKTSLTQTLSRRSSSGAVRLFVYGLLAYEPPFTFTSQKNATLNGYQRRFNLWDPLNRGTPGKPGLTLGLEEGGTCHGITYTIAESDIPTALTKVWEQEMRLPFYIPSWLTIDGEETLVMLTDPSSPALTGRFSIMETARVIATSQGEAGTNTEYLQNVVEAFANHRIADAYLNTVTGLLTTQQAA